MWLLLTSGGFIVGLYSRSGRSFGGAALAPGRKGLIYMMAVERRRRVRRLVGTMTMLAMVASACSGAATDRTAPTMASAVPEVIDPEVIDEAYVGGVLAELARIESDVIRDLIETGELGPKAVATMRALYASDHFLQLHLDELLREIDQGFDGFARVPGDYQLHVSRLVTATTSCIFVEASRNSSPLLESPRSPDTNWIVLVPTDPGMDPTGLNATGWRFDYYGLQSDGSAPPNPC